MSTNEKSLHRWLNSNSILKFEKGRTIFTRLGRTKTFTRLTLYPGKRVTYWTDLSGSSLDDCAKGEMATCGLESEVSWKVDKCPAFILFL
jgi:hypothetical protein